MLPFIEQLLGESQTPVGVERDEMLRRSRSWLDEEHQGIQWSLVWRHLVDENRLPTGIDRNDLLRHGRDWLTESQERNGWTRVLLRLLDEPNLPEDIDIDGLLRCGHAWLSGRENHKEWTFIWCRLQDEPELPVAIDRNELLGRGFNWLTRNANVGGWSAVWRRLIDTEDLPAAFNRDKLWRIGHDWLVGHHEHKDWTHVWRRLVDDKNRPAGSDRIDLMKRGHDWLASHRDDKGWSYIWQILLANEPAQADRRTELLTAGGQWLNRPENQQRGEWDKLFEQFLDARGTDDELMQNAAAWIWNHITQPQVPMLTAKLLGASTRPMELDDLAQWLFGWVNDNSDNRSVRAVVKHLRARIPVAAITELRSSPGWSFPLTSGWSNLLEWLASPQHSFDAATYEQLVKAQTDGQPIMGRISQRVRGGFVVELTDPAVTAFLPDGEADLDQQTDSDSYLGRLSEFRIIRSRKANKYILVSRRNDVAALRLASIQAGDRIDGVVIRLEKYGAFIDVNGIGGLLLKQEMAWRTVTDAAEFCSVGQRIQAVVTEVDLEKERVLLSLRQLTPSPWESIEQVCPPGSTAHGVVLRIVDYGLFVELDSGIQGLLHRSKIPNAGALAERFIPGERIQVRVFQVDAQQKRIDFTMLDATERPQLSWETIEQACPVGSTTGGKVKRIVDFGVFVELDCGLQGLLHRSNIPGTLTLAERFKLEKQIQVRVFKIDIQQRRIELILPDTAEQPRATWETVESVCPVGSSTRGFVRQILDFGVFVMLDCGLKGLLHNSRISGELPLAERFKIGEPIHVGIVKIDAQQHRIDLSMLGAPASSTSPWETFVQIHPVGSAALGHVKCITNYGVFVKLDCGVSGLLHHSKIPGVPELAERFKIGEPIQVRICEVDSQQRRIGFSMPNDLEQTSQLAELDNAAVGPISS